MPQQMSLKSRAKIRFFPGKREYLKVMISDKLLLEAITLLDLYKNTMVLWNCDLIQSSSQNNNYLMNSLREEDGDGIELDGRTTEFMG